MIKVAWNMTVEELEHKFTCPPNSTAALEQPLDEGAKVTESGKQLLEAGIAVDGEGSASLVAASYIFRNTLAEPSTVANSE